MNERAVTLRTLAVIGFGLLALIPILYYASTVDGRPPAVLRIALTQHLTGDADTALTTTSVEVDFSEPVEQATGEAAFAISPAVDGSFSWSAASMTFTPAARLPLRTDFEVTIGPGVRDPVGNAMTSGAAPFSFTTVGNPTVIASEPSETATEVPVDGAIIVDFSTLMDTASVEAALHLEPSTEVRLRWSRERLTIEPEAPLDANRSYTLTIGVGALDHAGTPLASPFTLTFRTVRTSLSAATLFPADGVAGVAVDTPVAIIFDRALDPEEVGDDLVSIEPSVAGSLDVIAPPGAAGLRDPEPRMLRFQPSGPLEPNTTYEITLRPGLRGADGAGLPAAISWSFTTGAPTATLSNQVVFLSRRAGIANLWAMNPDGTNQHQLSAELSPVIDYAVAPDGRAFVTGDGAAIVWQRADGSARRLLTDTGVIEFDPAYAPDGASLVFGRADPLLGTGLGLWTSDGEGSDPQPVEMPSDEGGSPSPTPATQIPLLRTPRVSPDGTALAFVDGGGLVAILDLETDQLTTAPFSALSEPVWLPDSSAVLVSGFAAGFRGEPLAYLPGTPVELLDPASANLDAGEAAALRIVRFERGAASVSSTALRDGAARPAVDDGGRIAYLMLEAAGAESGGPWLTSALDDPGDRAMGDPAARATFAAFTPEREALLVSRVSLVGAVTTRATGVWLVDLRTGAARQLSMDGWLPRWLP